jgi:hypothetical protein
VLCTWHVIAQLLQQASSSDSTGWVSVSVLDMWLRPTWLPTAEHLLVPVRAPTCISRVPGGAAWVLHMGATRGPLAVLPTWCSMVAGLFRGAASLETVSGQAVLPWLS